MVRLSQISWPRLREEEKKRNKQRKTALPTSLRPPSLVPNHIPSTYRPLSQPTSLHPSLIPTSIHPPSLIPSSSFLIPTLNPFIPLPSSLYPHPCLHLSSSPLSSLHPPSLICIFIPSSLYSPFFIPIPSTSNFSPTYNISVSIPCKGNMFFTCWAYAKCSVISLLLRLTSRPFAVLKPLMIDQCIK